MNARERFLSDKNLYEGYTDLMESPRMQIALDAAMVHLHESLKAPDDMQGAAQNEWKRQGALEFRRLLESLALPKRTKPKAPVQNLNHSA